MGAAGVINRCYIAGRDDSQNMTGARTMSSSEQNNKERNREIAHNEAARQTTGDIRVSSWAVAFAVFIGVIVVFVVWAWLKR